MHTAEVSLLKLEMHFKEATVPDPEQTHSEPVSRAGVDRNVSVQDGSDKVYGRPGPKGRGPILWVSLILTVIAAVLAVLYLF